MPFSADDELRRLRARAYGPAADIEEDPASVERLRELERMRADRSQRRGDAANAHPVDADVSLASEADPAVRELLGLGAPDDGGDHASLASVSEDARPTPRLSRRTKALWLGSVAATAALAAGVAVAVVGVVPVSASSGGPQIATLEPLVTSVLPADWFSAPADALTFEFHGVTVLAYAPGDASIPHLGPDDDCVLIMPTESIPPVDADISDGTTYDMTFFHSGCSTGRFPAAVALRLSEDAPEELRAAFPDARALQFVLEGDRVGVFLDDGG